MEGWKVEVGQVRKMQMELPEVLRELEHREIPHRKGQGAQEETAQKIGGEDRFQHVEHFAQSMPRGKTAPPNALPADPGQVQFEPASHQDVPEIGADRGDRHHGPGVVDHHGREQQRAMESPEEQGKRHSDPGVEPQDGIEGDGQPQPEAHGDPLRREIGVEDLVLQLDPETRLLEVLDERQ